MYKVYPRLLVCIIAINVHAVTFGMDELLEEFPEYTIDDRDNNNRQSVDFSTWSKSQGKKTKDNLTSLQKELDHLDSHDDLSLLQESLKPATPPHKETPKVFALPKFVWLVPCGAVMLCTIFYLCKKYAHTSGKKNQQNVPMKVTTVN